MTYLLSVPPPPPSPSLDYTYVDTLSVDFHIKTTGVILGDSEQNLENGPEAGLVFGVSNSFSSPYKFQF